MSTPTDDLAPQLHELVARVHTDIDATAGGDPERMNDALAAVTSATLDRLACLVGWPVFEAWMGSLLDYMKRTAHSETNGDPACKTH